MSGKSLHFLSEAKLAQTAGFIETGLASLARLQVTAGGRAIDARTLLEFAAMAEIAARLRQRLAEDLQPLLVPDALLPGTYAGIAPPGTDVAVQRLVSATRYVLDRLDEMIARLRQLQAAQADSEDLSARP